MNDNLYTSRMLCDVRFPRRSPCTWMVLDAVQQRQVCLGSMCFLPLSKTGEEFEGYSTTFWEPIKSWYSFGPIVVSTMTLTCFEAVKNWLRANLCSTKLICAARLQLWVGCQDYSRFRLVKGLFCICRAAKQTSFCFAKFCFCNLHTFQLVIPCAVHDL